MSNDHPGIVAAVSDAVESLGGNIDACSQTVLGGYFTLIMIISVPEPIESDLLAENIRGRDSRNAELQVMVLPSRHALPKSEEPCEQFVVTGFRQGPPGNRAVFQRIPCRQRHQHC